MLKTHKGGYLVKLVDIPVPVDSTPSIIAVASCPAMVITSEHPVPALFE
jgi:hypothetical protein